MCYSIHREAEGYGLPSGHSQSAVVVWGLIAAEFRKTWLWIVAVALMVLIGFSRIYLGVHFPTDVLGGWAVGTILLAVYIGVGSRFEGWLKQVGLAWRLALAIVIPLVLLLHSSPDTVSGLGVLMGMGVGAALTGEVAPYSAEGPLKQRILRFLVGIVGVLLIYLGLKTIFPEAGAPLYLSLRFVRYALVGLWAGVGAPWAFLRLGLAPHR